MLESERNERENVEIENARMQAREKNKKRHIAKALNSKNLTNITLKIDTMILDELLWSIKLVQMFAIENKPLIKVAEIDIKFTCFSIDNTRPDNPFIYMCLKYASCDERKPKHVEYKSSSFLCTHKQWKKRVRKTQIFQQSGIQMSVIHLTFLESHEIGNWNE